MFAKPFEPESELALVRRVMAREAVAIEIFARRLRCVPRMLSAQNVRFGGALDGDTLADLSQDIALVIWKKLGHYRAEAPLEAWVHGVCQLEFMNCLRRVRRESSRWVRGEPDAIPEESIESSVDAERVHLALARLGGVEALIIRAHHFEGLSFDQIAQREAMPPNTVKTRYYRALKTLQRLLQEESDQQG